MSIGGLIKARRLQLGMTQAELGIRSKCGQRDISDYELGKREPKVSRLIDIAAGLSMDIRRLIGELHEQDS